MYVCIVKSRGVTVIAFVCVCLRITFFFFFFFELEVNTWKAITRFPSNGAPITSPIPPSHHSSPSMSHSSTPSYIDYPRHLSANSCRRFSTCRDTAGDWRHGAVCGRRVIFPFVITTHHRDVVGGAWVKESEGVKGEGVWWKEMGER